MEIFFDGFLPQAFPNATRKKIDDLSDTLYLTIHSPLKNPFEKEGYHDLLDCLNFAIQIKAKIFTIHADYRINKFINFLEDFLANSNYSEIIIGIENIPGITVNEMNEIFNNLNVYPNLGVTFDISHAQLSPIFLKKKEKNAFKYLKNLNAPIMEIHLHNTDGFSDLHSRIREGIIDIREILVYMKKEKDFKGPYIIEYWRENVFNDYLWLHELLKEID